MGRSYDSSRRRAQAEATRRRILDAAVELHARGEMGYPALSAASGVPLPTVRHHFPDRERLFEGCTGHFFEGFEMPSLEHAAAIEDPQKRLRALVSAACVALEQAHPLLWHSAPLRDESPALRAASDAFSELLDGAAAALAEGRSAARRTRVRALLDPLTYRAFRVEAGLTASATRRELTALLRCALAR